MGTFTSVSLYDRGSTRPVSGRVVRVTAWPEGGPVETDPAVLATDYYGATPEFTTVDPDVHVVRITAASAQPRTLWSVEIMTAAADADARLTVVETALAGKSRKEPIPLGDVDLDTVVDDGPYVQTSSVTATAARHYPANSNGLYTAGLLEVVSHPGDYLVWQKFTSFNGLDMFWRARYGGTWYAWTRAARSTELDAKSPVGHTHDDRYYTEAEIGPRAVALDADGTPYWTATGGTHFVLTDSTGTPYIRSSLARPILPDTDGTPFIG